MINNSIKNYLTQTQQLFGDDLILSNIDADFFVDGKGSLDSKILFIKESLIDDNLKEEEKILFSNILKALNLSTDDIFSMSISDDQKNDKFSLLSNKITPSIIVVFGSCISEFFLKKIYRNKKIIFTYSLLDMINDSNYKKSVWKDLKPILNILK